MKTTIRQFVLPLLLFVFAASAQAAPLTWNLVDVEFASGATASGSFIYDADTDAYTNINITTTTDVDAAGALFEVFDGGGASDVAFLTDAISHLSEPVLQLVFQDPLTNAGGFVQIYDTNIPTMSSLQGTCNDINCNTASIDRYVVNGGVSTVPLPAGIWLFASALGILGFKRFRR